MFAISAEAREIDELVEEDESKLARSGESVTRSAGEGNWFVCVCFISG